MTASAPNHDELTRSFAFEADFGAGLRCIPMAVRYKLDAAGVKLSLRDWTKLDEAERRALLTAPCAHLEEVTAFAAHTIALVEARSGARPKPLPPVALDAWRAAALPGEVVERAATEGVALTADRWAGLTPLQRFALTKLARPTHDAANFAAALREFGVGV